MLPEASQLLGLRLGLERRSFIGAVYRDDCEPRPAALSILRILGAIYLVTAGRALVRLVKFLLWSTMALLVIGTFPSSELPRLIYNSHMQKEYLGKTKNGVDVYVDMEQSHASTHFAHHPKLSNAVKNIIPEVEVFHDRTRLEYDTDEEVGATDLVETNEHDEIVYAKRPLRTQYSRFVKNKVSTPTSWVTVDFRRVNDKEYMLYTAFVGRLTPSFPGGDFLPEQSKEFWSNHALVWGSQEVIPGSETAACPW